MREEIKAFVCGMLCMAALGSIPLVVLLYALDQARFTAGYTQGKQEGYKAGYVTALVNQRKGVQHDYILEEQDNGERVWKRCDEIGIERD